MQLNIVSDDHFRDHCGLFGVFGHGEAIERTFYGLYAQQHRGQESAGMAWRNGETLKAFVEMGLVLDIFQPRFLDATFSDACIGHVRYSTWGSSTLANAQPLVMRTRFGQLALALNGNIANAAELQAELLERGSILMTTTDTEILLHLISSSKQPDFESALIESLQRLKGGFCFLLLTPHALYAIRDPSGYRPLVLGMLGDAYVFASESCALDQHQVKAEYVREIEPGEILVCDSTGLRSLLPFAARPPQRCVFEHVYFSRPDSLVFDRWVEHSREQLGRQLAREQPVEADIVVPVPDSGRTAARGFSEESGIPLNFGLIRGHYIRRTFIEPGQSNRVAAVLLKLNAVKPVIMGKRVVLVDDSIVRGTTSQKIVNMVWEAGAREVHVRITSPPIKNPCLFGIDTPTKAELIASANSVEEIRSYLGATSLGYISLPGMLGACGECPDGPAKYCRACFNGDYGTNDLVSIESYQPALT